MADEPVRVLDDLTVEQLVFALKLAKGRRMYEEYNKILGDELGVGARCEWSNLPVTIRTTWAQIAELYTRKET